MRPRSMTGFGRGEASAEERTWIAEVRTVNHRFLDQRVVIPRQYAGFEEPVKKLVAKVLERGRVDVVLSLQGKVAVASELVVDEVVAGQYHRCLEKLVQDFSLVPEITLTHMLTSREIITQAEHRPDMDAEWVLMKNAVEQALAECDRMREREGAALKSDLLERLAKFEALVHQIESAAPDVLAQRHADLRAKLENLLGGIDLDAGRLAQEAAIITDKCDVTEELVRLNSHIEQFRSFLDSDEPTGRRLDFLLQEFLREVNTLASKISNATVAHLGVEMKNEIEKLREQVQNLE